jgi:hypothetical protein
VKFERDRSADLATSFDRCSKMCLPLVVVSLIAEVLVELTTPFTRKATMATMRRHATPSATIISTMENPKGSLLRRIAPLRLPGFSMGRLTERPS